MPSLTLIAAHDRRRAIGRGGQLPWRIAEDLTHFRRETLGNTLIVGRKTWDSLPGPLPGRQLVVLTRDLTWTPQGSSVVVARSPEEALRLARKGQGKPMVAGGAEIYRVFLPLATEQVITEVPLLVESADAYYPSFPEEEWRETRRITSPAGLVYRWLERR